MQPGFILPFGSEKKYFNKEDIETYGYSYNTDKAREILAEAGYSWNEEGKLLDKKKKLVRSISIECPQGWTDWIDAINVIVESFAEINKLLKQIPTITAEDSLVEAYRELNKLFMQTVPLIPVMYRPTTYYQFSTKHWTNFPTEENPYAPPNNLIVAAGVSALWEIVPVEQRDNQ